MSDPKNKLKDIFIDKDAKPEGTVTLEMSGALMKKLRTAAEHLGLTPEEALGSSVDILLGVSEKYKPGDTVLIVDAHDLVKSQFQLDIAPSAKPDPQPPGTKLPRNDMN